MTFNEAYLNLAEKIITDDFEGALEICDSFPEIEETEEMDFRNQLSALLSEPTVFKDNDVNALIDKFNFEKVEPLKAILDLSRNYSGVPSSEKIKKSEAYKLLEDESTEYFSDIEKKTLIRTLSTLSISSRDVDLIKFMLEKVKEFGI